MKTHPRWLVVSLLLAVSAAGFSDEPAALDQLKRAAGPIELFAVPAAAAGYPEEGKDEGLKAAIVGWLDRCGSTEIRALLTGLDEAASAAEGVKTNAAQVVLGIVMGHYSIEHLDDAWGREMGADRIAGLGKAAAELRLRSQISFGIEGGAEGLTIGQGPSGDLVRFRNIYGRFFGLDGLIKDEAIEGICERAGLPLLAAGRKEIVAAMAAQVQAFSSVPEAMRTLRDLAKQRQPFPAGSVKVLAARILLAYLESGGFHRDAFYLLNDEYKAQASRLEGMGSEAPAQLRGLDYRAFREEARLNSVIGFDLARLMRYPR